MNIPTSLYALMIKQIINEYANSNVYRAIASWCATNNYNGFAKYFNKQADEEKGHAQKFIDFITDRNMEAPIGQIPQPPFPFDNLLTIAELAYNKERQTTQSLSAIYEEVVKDKDYMALNFIQGMLAEQVEEENWTDELITWIKRAGDNQAAILALDEQWGDK